jgi:IS605 OrfB family transposase
VEHLLHIVTACFIWECVQRGVGEIAIGDLASSRDKMDDGARLNQRLYVWPYRKIVHMIRSTAARAGIAVRDDVDERGTSRTGRAGGTVREASRVHRGLYRGPCGWTVQADVTGALNISDRASPVSPAKGRPVVGSFPLGWSTVHEPKRRPNLRASA